MKYDTIPSLKRGALDKIVSLLELRSIADRAISDIENGKKGYGSDLYSFDDCFDINSFVEDS